MRLFSEEHPVLYLNFNKLLLSYKFILNCLTEFSTDEVAVSKGYPGTKNRLLTGWLKAA